MTTKQLRDGLIQDLAENVYMNYWFGLEGTQMLCEALEKQIPRKPTRDDCAEHIYYCPFCLGWFNGYRKPHHCECGQTLDWSDDDD